MLRTHGSVENNGHSILKEPDEAFVDVQSTPEDQPLLVENKSDMDMEKKTEVIKDQKAVTPPTKVLFLDGIRGVAAMMVVTQHSHEYLQDINLGAVAVDMFFVLSSFLLTWLFMKKSIRMLNQGAGLRAWLFALVDYLSKRFCRVYPLFALTCIVLWLMNDENKNRYYLIKGPEPYDLTVFVCEMLLPSPLSSLFEWNFLRHWGKISFSVYLLHGFVLYNEHLSSQPNYYCRLFSRFAVMFMLATTSHHLVEIPSQHLAQRITKALNEQETKGSGGLALFLGEWANPSKMLANRLLAVQQAKGFGKLSKYWS